MFIAVSFTIAKTWKQPKCPSTELKNMKSVTDSTISPSNIQDQIKFPIYAINLDKH